MSPKDLVSLINGLYEAGVSATVSIDGNNNVEVDIAPPDRLEVAERLPLWETHPATKLLEDIGGVTIEGGDVVSDAPGYWEVESGTPGHTTRAGTVVDWMNENCREKKTND